MCCLFNTPVQPGVLFIVKELFFLVLLTPWTHVNFPPQCFINNFFLKISGVRAGVASAPQKVFFDLQKKDSDDVLEFVRADNEQPTAAENW